ncbi:MAG: lysophospholipid acyltransferase family protein [Elusimicrobia bacterium]|nr:lysophospholipid acyltransferase family protein [Elusimicrobiota bacterium]
MGAGDRIRFFIEYVGLRILATTLGRIPPFPGMAMGRGMGRVVGFLARGRTRLAEQNMAAAFPNEKTDTLRAWVRGVWSELGVSVWEFARLGRMSRATFEKEVPVVGIENLRAAHAQGKGVILFTGHLGNWEYASWATALAGFPVAAIARRMKNPFVNDWITALRRRSGNEVLMHKNAVRESVRRLSAGQVVGLLFDQRITAGGLQVPFFGRPAHTTGMAALLALRLGSPLVPVHSWRENGRLTVEIGPSLSVDPGPSTPDRIEAVTRQMTEILEGWIRQHPTQWLWIHDRWRP